jgi:hypothetical protein
MNKSLAIFSVTLILLATVIGWVAYRLGPPSFLMAILVTLSAATWLVYFFVQRARQEDFIRNYLLTIVAKLLAGGIFVFVLLFLDKDGAEANAIFFMASYFLLTGLEVGFLFSRLR